jgi:hypothetical protein
MALETLALMIVGYIAANVATGFLEEPGKELYQKVKGLLKPDEMIKLNLLEQVPDSPKLQNEVATALDTHLKANPDIAAQLEKLLKQIPASQIKQNTMTQTGNNNIGLQDITGSDIKINQK